jgi:hypothetical protein
MGLFGFWVLGLTLYHVIHPHLPTATIMGGVGFLALTANVLCCCTATAAATAICCRYGCAAVTTPSPISP